ncbi:MAG TPA: pyridoxal 5'-phosphate synthase glutaminase subunit PdxT [Oscillospiraceae bacterium]|nr:pyridoxal 5'-phosphate synthase glutaminase subunit PdxT [Oscillospiraceae bacterium]HPS35865.1 pyridoxal 5'-phosphate synthase glutaminase subunit PdxT [Oscillospiraceae bacterium]
MVVAILAFQGAFLEHRQMLEKLGAESFEIRKKSDLNRPFDGLILPGGESTTMGKLFVDLDMMNPIRDLIRNGLPVFGTCAGMILLAKKIDNKPVSHLGTMDITVVRNAYGRQLGSFNTVSEFGGKPIAMTFIRAPYIKSIESSTKILSVVDHKIVAAQQGSQLVTAFHPELTNDTTVHQHFLNMIK